MHLYERRTGFRWMGLVIMVVVFLCAVLLFAQLLGRTGQTASREETALLEKAIRNAAVTCYAIDGVYPASLDEIRRDYGVIIDEERFIVRYSVFASNIIPQVSVIDKGGDAA